MEVLLDLIWFLWGRGELWLYCDLREALGGEKCFDLAMNLCEDILIFVDDMASQDQLAWGEGPHVELMQSEDSRELLQEELF